MTKVAVVAVHGVADQAPATSARSIADLLCTDPQYGSFSEVPLRIARERMEPGAGPPPGDDGLRYMHDQLREYRNVPAEEGDAGTVYDTVRLEGKRHRDGATVHVHEVYWADLSRAGETWYRLVAEFYQLILHLPSLGRNGLKYIAQASGRAPWKIAHALQRLAVWLLTVPAALLNLLMLSIGVIAISGEVPPGQQYAVALGAGTAILAGAPIVLLRALKARAVLWWTWPAILGVAAAAASLVIRGRNLFEVLAIEATLVAAGAFVFIVSKYRVMKPTAWPFGLASGAVMTVLALWFVIGNVRDEAGAYVAAIETVRLIYPSIVITWLLLFATATVAAIAGIAAALTAPRESRASAWRATWTARFSLGLPAALFAIFTLAIWYLVIEGIRWMSENSKPLIDGVSAPDIIENLLLNSAKGFEFFAGALVLFILAAVFATAPSIGAEIAHPRRASDADSANLGRWLTRGIVVVAAAAELFTITLVVMFASAFVPKRIFLVSETGLTTILAATAAGILLLLTGKQLIKTFRSAVDVLLDIDNYLRESPRNATPRARIAERFVSLLRHLCEWRDADGKPYDHIVIIAHSQGTVISADVLRYLNAVPDPRLRLINEKGIRLRFFTMGSPLRQVYSNTFPQLYAWIGGADVDPTSLRLEQWANVYCSGDYVGRNLWIAGDDRLWIRQRPASVDAEGKVLPRVEFCAGAGAHTHYWDHNAADVAAYLHSIV